MPVMEKASQKRLNMRFYWLCASNLALVNVMFGKKSRDIFIRESLKMKSVAFRMWLTELLRSQFKLKDYTLQA